jgi:hypothetical protein
MPNNIDRCTVKVSLDPSEPGLLNGSVDMADQLHLQAHVLIRRERMLSPLSSLARHTQS